MTAQKKAFIGAELHIGTPTETDAILVFDNVGVIDDQIYRKILHAEQSYSNGNRAWSVVKVVFQAWDGLFRAALLGAFGTVF